MLITLDEADTDSISQLVFDCKMRDHCPVCCTKHERLFRVESKPDVSPRGIYRCDDCEPVRVSTCDPLFSYYVPLIPIPTFELLEGDSGLVDAGWVFPI